MGAVNTANFRMNNMNQNNKNNFSILISIAVLGSLLSSLSEQVQAQEENGSCAMIVATTKNLPDKKFSLELIPLEGNHVNLAKCQEIDAQSIHLLPEQKLLVTLNKKWLFYQQAGNGTLGTNYNIQNDIKVDDWDGWENWAFDCTPLEWNGFSAHDFYNDYFYQAGDDSGKVTLSFISQTNPRYYSSLHIIID